MPVLTALQLRLVLQIGACYGVELSPDRAVEILGVLGAGYGMRTVAWAGADGPAILHEQRCVGASHRQADRLTLVGGTRTAEQQLLLGEWACLGILYGGRHTVSPSPPG